MAGKISCVLIYVDMHNRLRQSQIGLNHRWAERTAADIIAKHGSVAVSISDLSSIPAQNINLLTRRLQMLGWELIHQGDGKYVIERIPCESD